MAFRVQARLGRGRVVDTFDAVLDVQGEKLDVIIKRPRPEFREHTDVQEALLAWGQVQANLDHPDVVAVLEAGRDADGVYIIQEKVEGATLARLLKTLRRSHRTLTPANALLIAERTSSAVVGIHASAAGYHGDLQPREILIGYDGTVKVGGQRLTDLIAAAGLPPDPSEDHGYRSPELARRASRASSGRAASGAGARGAPGDGYAVALIILEMMLGHPVWQTSSMSVDDALRALVDLAPVAQGQPELAQSLYDLLQPWLQRQPSARPESFEAVAIGITQLMEDHGIRRNQEALGGFVELVVPPLEDADAPTRMAETPELDDDGALAVAPDRRAAFEAASVVITPEILAQAEAAYRKRAASERPVPPEPPPSLKPARVAKPRAATLEGRSLSVELPRSALAVGVSAPPPAPSALRAAAAEIPNVAAKAAAAVSEIEWVGWWPYAVGAVAIVLATMWAFSGGPARTIQLQVTSEPSAASVFVDNELVGETPLTRPLKVATDQIELRFEKVGFEAYRVTIGTTEDELRYEAPLKPAR